MTTDDLKAIDELIAKWRSKYGPSEATYELEAVRDALAAKMSAPPHCPNCSCLYEAAKMNAGTPPQPIPQTQMEWLEQNGIVEPGGTPPQDQVHKYWQDTLMKHHRVRNDDSSREFPYLCNCAMQYATVEDWIGHVRSVVDFSLGNTAPTAKEPNESGGTSEDFIRELCKKHWLAGVNYDWRAIATELAEFVARRERAARSDEFKHVIQKRPLDPIYWDMHHRRELEKP
jgi:hypothetical protein